MKDDKAEVLSIDGREVTITNPAKPYFSKQTKLSKLDLVRYYLAVAPGALNGIRDRPLVLKRFVDGAEGEAFYQKRAPGNRPSWLRTVTLSFPSGRKAEEIVVDDAAGLAWVVNLGCLCGPAISTTRTSSASISIRIPALLGTTCAASRSK
jgi:DNA primase